VKGAHQLVDGPGGVLLGPIGELSVQRRGGGAGVAQQALDVSQAQAVLEQTGRKAVPQTMDGNFFLDPALEPHGLQAAWVPPRSMCVVALRIRSGEPTGLGNNSRGLRCLRHRARSAW
jgi:hypothetical protein